MTGIDRRRVMVGAALASAGALLRTLSGNEPPRDQPSMGLGFSLYGMKSLQLADALRIVREIGYDCVELPVLADWPADSRRWPADERRTFRDALSARRLRLSALMENLPLAGANIKTEDQATRLKLALDLSRELVPDAPPPVETILGGQPARWEAEKNELVDRLGAWARLAAERQVVVAIKPHVAGAMHRPEHAVWLLEQVASPWIRAAFDFSHYQLRDIPLDDAVRALASLSVFTHVKDARGSSDKFQFLLPGEGTIDYTALFKNLVHAGYRGDVVVEVSGQIHSKPEYDPQAAARKSYEPLALAFERAGLKRRQ